MGLYFIFWLKDNWLNERIRWYLSYCFVLFILLFYLGWMGWSILGFDLYLWGW